MKLLVNSGGKVLVSNGLPITSPGLQDINFYDYDGTLIKGYTISQAQELTSLPVPPTHDGLIFQEWNYTLAQVNAATHKMDIGATYTTASGKTEVDITLTPVTGLTCTLQNLTGMTSIDWGDGTVNNITSHTYTEYGNYAILIDGVTQLGSYAFSQSQSVSNYYCTAIRIPDSVTSIASSAFSYCRSLQSVVIPNSVTSIGSSTFTTCRSLQSVVIPSSVTSIANATFNACSALQSIVIPSSVISIGSSVFNFCYSLQSLVIPSSVTSIGMSAFNTCYSLQSLVIPSGVTSIGISAFYYCFALQFVVIPSSVTSINISAFYNCYACKEYNFSTHTAVPTLADTRVFTGINSICKIKVPTALYDEWIAATNWATYANYIVAV